MERDTKDTNLEREKMKKKGAWTAEEDAVLIEYVKSHGEGRWNMVERTTSLKRCGKSCRLRWCNHLRPNLKKGPFTPQEEMIVIELHAKIGNRWAQMATKLPGRTDNEIKNYWHTRTKKFARAGIPLYPEGIVPQYNHLYQYIQSHTILSQSPNYATNFLTMNGIINTIPPESGFHHNYDSYPRIEDDRNLSLESNSISPPLSYPNTQHLFSTLPYQFQSQSSNFNANPNPIVSMPNSFDPQGLFPDNEGVLSSIQTLFGCTPDFSELGNGENSMNVMPNFHDPQYGFESLYTNNGLLGDITRASTTSDPSAKSIDKGKEICIWNSDYSPSFSNPTNGMLVDDPIEAMFPVEIDYLPDLLANLPMEFPSSELNQGLCGNSSNEYYQN